MSVTGNLLCEVEATAACEYVKVLKTQGREGKVSLASDDTNREPFAERPRRDLGTVSSLNGFATLILHKCQKCQRVQQVSSEALTCFHGHFIVNYVIEIGR